MGKILDFIVKKGDGNYVCYKTNKVSLDVTDNDILSYDDKPASSKSSSKIAESDLSRVHKVPINERLMEMSRPIFHFFLVLSDIYPWPPQSPLLLSCHK